MHFEDPTPPIEQEPHYPSLEEIKNKIEEIAGKETLEVLTVREDENGVSLYEVSTVDEKGDATIFTYRRGGDKAASTDITATYYVGSLENGIPTSAENLSTYNSSTGQWTDALKNEDIEYKVTTPISSDDIAHQEAIISPEFEFSLTALSSYIKTNKPGAAEHKSTEKYLQYVAEIQSSREQDPANLYKLFDEAEASFGSVEIKDVLYREEHDMPAALKAREKLSPLMRILTFEFVRLNKSEGLLMGSIPWNPKGSLTKEQFDDLNLRRRKLANAYGSLRQDPINFKVLGIDHDRFKF